MHNQKKLDVINQIITILSVFLSLIGSYCIFYLVSLKFEDDPEIAAGFGALVIMVFVIIGLIISAIGLGVAMEHEVKNRKLTILPLSLFLLSLLLFFLN